MLIWIKYRWTFSEKEKEENSKEREDHQWWCAR
jgi:hypothetical protein